MTLGLLVAAVATFAASAVSAGLAWYARGKLAEIHVLVNSKLTAWIDRAAQLVTALEKAGVAVPPGPAEGSTRDPNTPADTGP